MLTETMDFLKAMADENRLKMMDLLRDKPMCVSEICRYFDMRQPSVSHHLTILKKAGIISAKRCGKEVIYMLKSDVVCEKFDDLTERFDMISDEKTAYELMVSALEWNPALFRVGLFGLEKENLRINDGGCLDQSDHPVKKDDPYYEDIVKDFAECQAEFVTKPAKDPMEALNALKALQDHFIQTYDVRLWPFSMPACIKEDLDIRIAEYDDTPEGRSARAYREMLAKRHGRKMQLISGVHYNFSFGTGMIALFKKIYLKDQDLEDQQVKNLLYFHVARNMLRYKWLLIYIYGASPFVDVSYKEDVTQELKAIEHNCHCCNQAHTYYEDYATSLRMSRYGYHNKLQEGMSVSYNRLEEYVSQMRNGIDKGILQKESEYYAPLRFKNSKGIKGSMLDALEADGVEYLELRMFDLNPYESYGVTEDQMYLTHLFLVYSLMKPSPCIDMDEMARIYANGQKVSLFGRKEGEQVYYWDKDHDICSLGCAILEDLSELAVHMDRDQGYTPYQKAVQSAKDVLDNPELLPSKQLFEELMNDSMTFIQQGVRHSIGKEKVK